MTTTMTLGKTSTTVSTHEHVTYVRYHSTDVVTFDSTYITLKKGGWETVTTKRRMNQTANQFGLDYQVFAKKGDWFVTMPNGETVPFYGDSLSFSRRI